MTEKEYEVSGESRFRIYKKYFFKAKNEAEAIKKFFKAIGGKPFKNVSAKLKIKTQ